MSGKAIADVVDFLAPMVAAIVLIGCFVFIIAAERDIHQRCEMRGGTFVSGRCLVGVKAVDINGP